MAFKVGFVRSLSTHLKFVSEIVGNMGNPDHCRGYKCILIILGV